MAEMDLILHTDGPVLEFPPDTWRTNPEAVLQWRNRIRAAVNDHDPWALLAMRPDGDLFVFDCSETGIWECARWSTRVRLMFDPKGFWDES